MTKKSKAAKILEIVDSTFFSGPREHDVPDKADFKYVTSTRSGSQHTFYNPVTDEVMIGDTVISFEHYSKKHYAWYLVKKMREQQ